MSAFTEALERILTNKHPGYTFVVEEREDADERRRDFRARHHALNSPDNQKPTAPRHTENTDR